MHEALYIDPACPPAEPVIDSLTRRAAYALARARIGRSWGGIHKCSCGALSTSADLILRAIVGEIQTHSLMVHCLAVHRAEIPEIELGALDLLLPKQEEEPTALMIGGNRYHQRWAEEPWCYGGDSDKVDWPSRSHPGA